MAQIYLKKLKKAHFIGIGGIGMSAVARMFLLQGKSVSGSDLSDSPIIEELSGLGAKIKIGEGKKNLPEDTQLVVYTVAIPPKNPELKKSLEKKIPTLSYPQVLGLISKEKFTIAVSGTHGKTTTTAMIATAMIDAGLDPTVVVGSLLKDQKSNFIAGKSGYFVVEACEYKRSFLELSPSILVITNIDDDHLDYYGNIAGVQKGFKELAEKLKENDFLVCNPRDPNVRPILRDLSCAIFDYTSTKKNFELKIPGKHNVENAQAALNTLRILGVPEKQAIASLERFSGTWRRFEYKGKTTGEAVVYDDYAHHPTEIKATLAGARELFPKKNIVVVFQPHLYSRTKEHRDEFAPAFKQADSVIFAPIYAAREPMDKSISSEILAKAMRKSKGKAVALQDFETIIKFLKGSLKSGDILITMGAGDINKVAEAMVQ